jgi:hypothetical protein
VEVEAGVHQVKADRETGSPVGEDQCKKVYDGRDGAETIEVGGLLVEGEEQEYFLELLMRRASPDQPMENLPPENEASFSKGRKNRSLGKKIRRKKLSRGTTGKEPRREKTTDPAGGGERQVASNLAHNPEAKGRGLAGGDQQKKNQAVAPLPTSGGECSG